MNAEEDHVMSEPNTDFPHIPWLPAEHFENQKNFPREQLDAYRGQYIAWNWEGDRIVGHAPTREELRQQLLDEGVNPQQVVFDYVDDL
jgi:hypothetical protein